VKKGLLFVGDVSYDLRALHLGRINIRHNTIVSNTTNGNLQFQISARFEKDASGVIFLALKRVIPISGNDCAFVIPECSNRESITLFQVDSRLKIAGMTCF